MHITLGLAFRALMATLHSAIDGDQVEAFAQHLEHLEDRLNTLEHGATEAGATWVENIITGPPTAR